MKEHNGINAMLATDSMSIFPVAGDAGPWSGSSWTGGQPSWHGRGPDGPAHRIVPVYWAGAATFGIVAWTILLRLI
mgnify:CR=1 FL=1|jgi:hypothetical protein